MPTRTYRVEDSGVFSEPLGLVRHVDDMGFVTMDLAQPPSRFWGGRTTLGPVRHAVDEARISRDPSPIERLGIAPTDETTTAQSRRALSQLFAWFLLAEDPQRRLDAKPVSTLAHQASLVRHVLSQPSLKSVLIADEVGLGKTVEAGLIIKELAEAKPGLRVLYLAPAGLVRNVHTELRRLELAFRMWIAGMERDARLSDAMVVASIHRAVHPTHFESFLHSGPWDVLVVDECHHLSDWQKGGGKPTQKYKLVDALRSMLPSDSRLILMSGTPHQGNPERFENVLALLARGNESRAEVAARVIYRTKEDVRDWDGRPLFPKRNVHPPLLVDLGPDHRQWLEQVHRTFEMQPDTARDQPVAQARRRALDWRCGQALQWATSSIEAGLGYLVRQSLRAGWTLDMPALRTAVAALRPYRRGAADEDSEALFERIRREIGHQAETDELEDIEDGDDSQDTAPGSLSSTWRPQPQLLSAAMEQGVQLLNTHRDARWDLLREQILDGVPGEKVVLFAQPIETVTALAAYLERIEGVKPAMIIGGQRPEERTAEVERFWRADGPRFLVSSRAGGEGYNLQIAHVLVHVDVPWNPMELEQRVGRVHRFMSRKTIQVHTLVVKDSREVDMYDVARSKLRNVAETLGRDRFEDLFSRVMALVPPEELAGVLVRDALGPLNDADQAGIAQLVAEAFRRWKKFDGEFSANQHNIRSVPAGDARWSDVARFLTDYLGGTPVAGLSALRFREEDGAIVEASEDATVIDVAGQLFACGDYGATPISSDDGRRARQVGLNVDEVCAPLRKFGLPSTLPGVAYLKIGERPAGLEWIESTCGILIYGRLTLAIEASAYRESGLELEIHVVSASGEIKEVKQQHRGALVRGLLASAVRRDPEIGTELAQAMAVADQVLETRLRKPPGAASRYVVWPIAAVIAG